MKTLAERLTHARTSKGELWSQKHLAVAADVSLATIGMMESGKRGNKGKIPGTLPQIARALGVRFDWLAYCTGEMLPEAKPEPPMPTTSGGHLQALFDMIPAGPLRESAYNACFNILTQAIRQAANPPTADTETTLSQETQRV